MTWHDRLSWEDFHPGVKKAVIVPYEDCGRSVVLLQYEKNSSTPHHSHAGQEVIYILSGSQKDERGVYRAGECIINPPGTSHAVSSDEGCLALLVYEEPVVWTAAPAPDGTKGETT